MTEIDNIRIQLESKSDLDWFKALCDILKKDSNPTTLRLTNIIGTEKPNPKNEIRGSKFLDTFDKRFKSAFINPILGLDDIDRPLDYLGFLGGDFKLRLGDISEWFKSYKVQDNTYDGGTQIFFYPVPIEYDFTALDFWTEIDKERFEKINDIIVNGVSFRFGNKLTLGRDGFGMKRY